MEEIVSLINQTMLYLKEIDFILLRLHFLLLSRLPKLPSQCQLNMLGNMGSLHSNKEIQPQFL